MLPDGARDKLLDAVNSARDRLVVTWLSDGGLRIGELCGLHLVDLHLRDDAPAGSAAPRTCMSATGRITRTAPRRRPNTPGGSRTTP